MYSHADNELFDVLLVKVEMLVELGLIHFTDFQRNKNIYMCSIWEGVPHGICKQSRPLSDCTFVQSDQSLL